MACGLDAPKRLALLLLSVADLQAAARSTDPVARRVIAQAVILLGRAQGALVVRYPGDWYPRERNDNTDDEQYHYWVIRHLAARLVEQGHAPAEAFLAPFLLNTEYELGKQRVDAG